MRKEPHTVIAEVSNRRRVELPDTPYALWARGELDRLLLIPDDGSRVEVIGEEIFVTPPQKYAEAGIASEVHTAFMLAVTGGVGHSWQVLQAARLDLLGIENGYIPDLIVIDLDIHKGNMRAGDKDNVLANEVQMAVEITSPSNAVNDRRPMEPRAQPTKWEGYARAEIPYYLLIDRDPKVARSTLYSIPDQGAAAYLHEESWAFGGPIRLPDPFGVEIPTTDWQPWSDGPG